MRDRRELMTHILMVVAPLVMLAALSMAWFINSNTVGLSTLSFASQNTGPGAALHFGEVVKGARNANANTLTNTVKWGPEEKTEDSAIIIENMVPGQCEYYLLVGNEPITVSLTDVVFREADGNEVPTGADLPLAQCLGFYLLPVNDKTLEAFDWDWNKDPTNSGTQPSSQPTITLVRDTAEASKGQLTAAVLKGAPPTDPLAPVGNGDPAKAYILAIYCDPVYLQGKAESPVNTLAGSISFGLSFPKGGAAGG